MTKGSICQEDIVILNICAQNNRTGKCMKQKLIKLKREIGKSTTVVGDFNSPLSAIDRTLT